MVHITQWDFSRYKGANPRKVFSKGEDFLKLRQEFSEPRPRKGLADIEASKLHEILGCVRCGDIPDPNKLMACESGHYTCIDCYNRDRGISSGEEKKCAEEGATEKVELCCEFLNLRKEPGRFLKAMLGSAMFCCRNAEKGCPKLMLGSVKFHDHVKFCEFGEFGASQARAFHKCRFHDCTEKRNSVKELLDHYEKAHDGCVLTMPGKTIKFPIDFKETQEKRLCAILKWKGKHFVFACQVNDGFLFIWMWALEQDAVNLEEKKTDTWYRLRINPVWKQVGRKEEDAEERELMRDFTSSCLHHSVETDDILGTSGVKVDGFKMNLRTFKDWFVQETANGNGKWWAVVTLMDKKGKKKVKGQQ